MDGLTTRLKAATLLEVIVSMLVILAVFGIAMAIYARVSASSPSVSRQQAEALARRSIQQIAVSGLPADTEEWTDSLRVVRKVLPYSRIPGVMLVEVSVYQQDSLKARRRQLVKQKQ